MASGHAGFSAVLKIGGEEVTEAKDVTVNLTRSEIEDTARDTNGWRSFIAGLAEWTIEFNLLKKYPRSTPASAIETAFLNGTILTNVRVEDAEGYGITGDAVVTDYTEEQPYEDVVANSITLRGRGEPTQVSPSS